MGVMLTGSEGMIGSNLKELLPPMLCPTHEELDLTDTEKTKKYLQDNKPDKIIHCASNDSNDCLFANLKMFANLADSHIPMITFCTGLETENRVGKSGQYVMSKSIIKELALRKYNHILMIKLWGCFGKYEKPIRFFTDNFNRVKKGEPIFVRKDKFFSYVYVKDLAKIIKNTPVVNKLYNIVAYTRSLYEYALLIKRVTGSDGQIEIGGYDFNHSYMGRNDFDFEYTDLEEAIKELWSDFNTNTST